MHASGESKTASGGLEAIKLIEPNLECDGSLAEALRARRTVREFSDEALSPQTLSDLLWAACGINRLYGPFGVAGRTAASASNSQEVDVYVALSEGTYRYDPTPQPLTDCGRRLPPVRPWRTAGRRRRQRADQAHLCRRHRQARTHSGLRRTGPSRTRGAKILLLRRHWPDRGQRLPVRRFARPRRLVPQLRSGGVVGEARA